ncbi:hypothetical protein GMORB2_6105 [Geosmithia morbida]|uniref:Uncharacterized protein n=1 Tax=Geosmithia morbida TaxID=1094350 RepID=A0A9P4YYM2_9HYPO|nr:uncharacterized protein GMORB2_6105 [Geosmithia morbida]KAF4123404.1 hypothetical protein GMORB2_6105 [Geosmithia morbida]
MDTAGSDARSAGHSLPSSRGIPANSAPQGRQISHHGAPSQFGAKPSLLSTPANSIPAHQQQQSPQQMHASHPTLRPGRDGSPAQTGRQKSPETMQADAIRNSHYYMTLSIALKQTPAPIVQQAIRDYWAHCFVGSDQHTAFILNGMIQQASPAVLQKCVLESGAKMSCIANHLLGFFSTEGLDQVTDLILSKASSQFLDKAMEARLKSIDARSLVNALARAERLGYDENDVVRERAPGQPENVIPAAHNFSAPLSLLQGANSQPSVPSNVPAQVVIPSQQGGSFERPVSAGSRGICYCPRCQRPCSSESALQYHLKKNACEAYFPPNRMFPVEKLTCAHCGCRFTTENGVNYHSKCEVCGEFPAHMLPLILKELEARNSGDGNSGTRGIEAGGHQRLQRHRQQQSPSSAPAQSAEERRAPTEDKAHRHMSLQMWQQYQKERSHVEVKYGRLMQQALKLPERQRVDQFVRLRNRYNTKQSTTRKKFGIRLRERRTREDIDAERRRLLGTSDGPEIWLQLEALIRKVQAGDPTVGTGAETPVGQAASQNGTRSGGGHGDQASKPSQAQDRDSPSPDGLIRSDLTGGLPASAGSIETTDPTTDPTTATTTATKQGFRPPRMHEDFRSNAASPPQQRRSQQARPAHQDVTMIDSDDDDDDDGSSSSSDDDSSDGDEDVPSRR